MIVEHDILMILLGAIISAVGILTGQYFYGKRMSVANWTRVENDTVREYPKPGQPSVDRTVFTRMIEGINLADDSQTFSRELKDKVISREH